LHPYKSECYNNCTKPITNETKSEETETCNKLESLADKNCSCTECEYEKEVNAQSDQFATAVSMFTIGGMIGSFLTTFFVTRFGRKGAQMANCGISIVGGCLYILSYYIAR